MDSAEAHTGRKALDGKSNWIHSKQMLAAGRKCSALCLLITHNPTGIKDTLTPVGMEATKNGCLVQIIYCKGHTEPGPGSNPGSSSLMIKSYTSLNNEPRAW